MNENQKYEIIKDYVDHGGNKNRISLKLGITIRHLNRLIKLYLEKGKAGFVHGNRNRQPVNTLPKELTDKIVDLYQEDYQDFSFEHIISPHNIIPFLQNYKPLIVPFLQDFKDGIPFLLIFSIKKEPYITQSALIIHRVVHLQKV